MRYRVDKYSLSNLSVDDDDEMQEEEKSPAASA